MNNVAPSIDNNPLSAAIDQYTRYHAAGSSHTARAKRLDITAFTEFLEKYRRKGYEALLLSDWDASSVEEFIDNRLAKGEAPATVARRLATIKHLGRFLAENNPGFKNPAKDSRPPKLKATAPQGLSPKELQAIREVSRKRLTDKDTFIRQRNVMLFEFLLDTGLRAEEARILKLGQINSELTWISNVRTKGRRFRKVYISSETRTTLNQYLELRAKELKKIYPKLTKAQSEGSPLFPSLFRAKADKPESLLMGAKTVWRAVRELSVETKLHPHLMRHCFALDLLDSSRDIRLVSQALGHSDVRITMRYTERTEEDIAKALEESREKKG